MEGKNKFGAGTRVALALAGAALALAAHSAMANGQDAKQVRATSERMEAARPDEMTAKAIDMDAVVEVMRRKAEPVEMAEARAYVDMALKDCWLLLEKDSRADVLWVHADEVLAVLPVEKGAIRVLPRLEGWPRSASAYRTISSRIISSERMGELVEAQLRRRIHECKRGTQGWRDIESSGR